MHGNEAGDEGELIRGGSIKVPSVDSGDSFLPDFLRIAQSALWNCLLARCEPGAFIHLLPLPID